jgi:pimeloyl-ACP methyl ester carboxylesterase
VVHYETIGDGTPIIMLHGWYLDHRSIMADLEPVFRTRRGWKRIYLDLPGMGRTQGIGWIANNDNMLKVVHDFIDTVIPGQRFVIAGYSYGGYLARGVVYHKSDLMDGLLLIAPIIRPTQFTPSVKHVFMKDKTLLSELTGEERAIFDLAVI